jgi:putative FmdB family regulatory protein
LTERIQKFSDPPMTVCPHCQGEVEQLVSAASVRFKGSGWYVTDYAKKGSGKADSSGNGSPAASSAESKKDNTKAESTPRGGKSDKK